MSYTEEQAKDLWCPMVRELKWARSSEYHSDKAAVACNTGARCIGSQCAMWRWETMADPTWIPVQTLFPAPPECAPTVRANTGYCGIAGKPIV